MSLWFCQSFHHILQLNILEFAQRSYQSGFSLNRALYRMFQIFFKTREYKTGNVNATEHRGLTIVAVEKQ